MDVTESLDVMGIPMYTIKSPKFAATFEVRKKFGRGHYYEIKISKGSVPKELSGLYTNQERALDALKLYTSRAKDSSAVQRNKKTQRREKFNQDAAASRSDNKELIQQGSSD